MPHGDHSNANSSNDTQPFTAVATTIRTRPVKPPGAASADTPAWWSERGARQMRVLFYYRGIESLGIGYLMSTLKAHGHTVDLLFEPGLDDNGFLNIGPLKRLNHEPALLERARQFRPDLVAIGSTTNQWSHAARWAEQLKAALDVPVLVGGHHAQALPELVISHPAVDFVCTGEGEIALLHLVNRMSRGEDVRDLPTLWAKQDGTIYRNEIGPLENNLDNFAFPEKALWYEYGAFRHNLEVFTGRGCPFKCTFCNIHFQREQFSDHGDFLRKRSVANVITELEENLRTYDPKYVSVHDDNFTANVRWVEEFCDIYRDKVGLPWFCFGYPTTIRSPLLRAMAGASCKMIFMGVDSGDEEVRKTLMERPMTDELIYSKSQMIHDHGIGTFLSTIYGSPGETASQMMKTLDMVAKIRPTQCSGNVFYPLPRTKLYDKAVELGQLSEAGQHSVQQGESGFHGSSILDHPEAELAELLATVTPMYARSPDWLRKPLRFLVEHRAKRTLRVIYVVTAPIAFTFVGKEMLDSAIAMTVRGIKLRAKYRPRRRDRPKVRRILSPRQ